MGWGRTQLSPGPESQKNGKKWKFLDLLPRAPPPKLHSGDQSPPQSRATGGCASNMGSSQHREQPGSSFLAASRNPAPTLAKPGLIPGPGTWWGEAGRAEEKLVQRGASPYPLPDVT